MASSGICRIVKGQIICSPKNTEEEQQFDHVLRLLERVQMTVNNCRTVAQLYKELHEQAESIVETIQHYLSKEEIGVSGFLCWSTNRFFSLMSLHVCLSSFQVHLFIVLSMYISINFAWCIILLSFVWILQIFSSCSNCSAPVFFLRGYSWQESIWKRRSNMPCCTRG